MAKTKTKQEGRKVYIIKRTIDVIFAVALVVAVILIIRSVTRDMTDIKPPKVSDSDIEMSQSEGKEERKGDMIFSSELMDDAEIGDGPLALVNNDNEYKGSGDDLVSVYDIKDEDGTDSYTVMSADVKLKTDAAKALNEMVKAFAKEKGHDDIVVDGGYRSKEEQQELYDAAEDKSAAAKPGCSDYHAGCSIDFGISSDDGTVADFDGTGDYAWFEQNCYKYGFVLRYPEGKQDKTGYDYRPWHFRYVGKEHAYYMTKNGLCLEEYIETLKNYTYEKEHLTFQDDENNYYEVYSFPKDTENKDMTMVAVPSGIPFQVSGDNIDSFIISFDKYANIEPEDAAKANDESTKSEDETSKAKADEEA